jgi:hypothetical protein
VEQQAPPVPEPDPPFPVSERDVPLDTVVGPGRPYELRWEDQTDTGYCATCGPATIVSEVSGRPVERDEVVARAAEAGLLSFDDEGNARGTSPSAVGDLLAAYGVDSVATAGADDAWKRLDDALAADRRVVLPLDQPGYGKDGEQVSVAVTAVDSGRGVVLAADSAGGAPLEIPLDTFEQAWGQSDFALTSVSNAPYDLLGMTLHPELGPAMTTNPLTGLPTTGSAALGEWWAAADDPVTCCVAPAEPAATGLTFTDESGDTHVLPGVDTTGTGQADAATLDANQDGVPDTWMFDTTGTGEADLVYYDSTGTGEPDSVSYTADNGRWAEPMPLTTALNAALPGTTPGAPIAIPADQAPVDLIDLLSANTVPADQLQSTGANLVITYDQPQGTNLVITDPQPEAGEYIVLPSPYMPTADQGVAVFGPLSPPLLGQSIDPNAPVPRLDPNFTDVFALRQGLQRAYAHQAIVGNVFLMPEGVRQAYDPLTASVQRVVADNSTYPSRR